MSDRMKFLGLIMVVGIVFPCCGGGLSKGSAGAFFLNDVRIPMRDGVTLAGDIYLPSNRTEKVGCCLRFSPYEVTQPDKPTDVEKAEAWGVAMMKVDCRGRCHSEGVFDPWNPKLTDDADDLLSWIAVQAWSNGKVVMTGKSYEGFAQLAALRSGNPALVAATPGYITLDPYPINFQNGIAMPYFFKRWHSRIANKESWKAMSRHALRDKWWGVRSDTQALGRTRARVLYQAGWFDFCGVDAFNTFHDLPEGSVMIIGAWGHGEKDNCGDGCRSQDASFVQDVEVEFLRTALANQESATRKWPGRILMYVMGLNVWRYEKEWPLARTIYRDYDFTKGETRSFIHDPENPVPMNGGRIVSDGGQRDQRKIERRSDVLSYTGEVLDKDLEITGEVEADLFISSTAACSDVVVRLVDVHPSGCAMNVLEGINRMYFKRGETIRSCFKVDTTSYVFRKGHRLRIDMAGSCSPHFTVNQNPAEITVHADSKLRIPTISALEE